MKVEDVKLREFKLAGAGFRARDVHGRLVKVKISNLKDRHKAELVKGLRFIRDRLQPNEIGITEKAICVAASRAVFVTTRHKTIEAYTSADRENPFIVLNEHPALWNDPEEFAVTLLHELLHVRETMGLFKLETSSEADRQADSKKEAIHDLLCYSLLDLEVSRDHWAFKKYPELLRYCSDD